MKKVYKYIKPKTTEGYTYHPISLDDAKQIINLPNDFIEYIWMIDTTRHCFVIRPKDGKVKIKRWVWNNHREEIIEKFDIVEFSRKRKRQRYECTCVMGDYKFKIGNGNSRESDKKWKW